MKKLISFLVVVMGLYMCNAYAWKANFNYGQDTYEKWDNILIVNSLGDETVESRFSYKEIELGYNDYIPENAFKNNLYNEGYTKVYDFNNSSLDLTSVGYMGRLGDPRAYDEDYILTSEWEKYSSQFQDKRIKTNKKDISTNVTNISTNKNNIKINKGNVVINKDNIEVNENNIGINKNNIGVNKSNISKVEQRHTNWNMLQDTDIQNNTTNINNNKLAIREVDNRVSELEETQYVIETGIRIFDSKKLTVSPFTRYNFTRNKLDTVGIRFTIKIGLSYEEKLIEKQDLKLRELERKLEKLNRQ